MDLVLCENVSSGRAAQTFFLRATRRAFPIRRLLRLEIGTESDFRTIVFPPSVTWCGIVVVLVVGEKSYHNKFLHNQCACMLLCVYATVCCSMGRAPRTTTRASGSLFASLAREFEKKSFFLTDHNFATFCLS